MIKIMLCMGVIVFCGVIGYGVSNFYILRKKFFFCFNHFLICLKSDISFNAYNLVDIISKNINQNYQSKEFKILLESYKYNLQGKLVKEAFFKDIKILTAEEQDGIFNFFNALGKTDIKMQLEEIEKVLEANNLYYIDAKEESKKYSSLYTKLGVIIGAFIAVLII